VLSERIHRLREQTLQAIPTISVERAELLTEFYRSGIAERVTVPMSRALAFQHLLANKTICINPGELIVGERGPEPKATPTYPEICTHTLDDFDMLHSREKVSFNVSEDARRTQSETIIPFWSDRSIRDRIFEQVDNAWKDAYKAGVFTEFQEQRAPGHTVLDDKIYKRGFLDFKKTIEKQIESLDFMADPKTLDKREELRSMAVTADAIMTFAERHAQKLQQLADNESDPDRKHELRQMQNICRRVPHHAPQTFWEALQYYWFIHLGVITELNTWDSFNPGRLDQHLWPFYQREIAAGTLTEQSASELLQAFWIKFNNQPAPPKVGVTAKESATYTDFCLINLGGVTQNGEDAANDLTYLLLDVIEEMRILQPSSMVQISRKNPDLLLRRALNIIKTGFGQPSLFNTDAIIAELMRQGKSVADARDGGASGCVETGAFGKEAYILTGYFNLVKVLEVTLHNGLDPRTGKRIGIETGAIECFTTFDSLYEAFEEQLAHFINIKIKGNRIVEQLWARYLPAPFLSILIDDCITTGTDYNCGGARYNTSYIQGVGMGTITDSLAAIKLHVFDTQNLNMSELLAVLESDYKKAEDVQKTLRDKTPRFGNDDDYADDILRKVFESYFKLIDGRPNVKGGQFRINLLSTTCHIYFGSVVGATPDGRKAGQPLSEGISPVQGADRKGPTAVLKSAAKIRHLATSAKRTGETQGFDCAGGRLQRLFRRSRGNPSKRDYRSDRAEHVIPLIRPRG